MLPEYSSATAGLVNYFPVPVPGNLEQNNPATLRIALANGSLASLTRSQRITDSMHPPIQDPADNAATPVISPDN